ncbi:O-antigen ligase domain-containing protein [Pseudooceanicola sp. MF1-13]|uniref:O-antigen ligase domain-containing protein n=1 Tax=Pseudooceanicola sp. MF1-13 TaxID=3379095 RepID=UPI00389240B7
MTQGRPTLALIFLTLIFVPIQAEVAGLVLTPLRLFLLACVPVLSVGLLMGRFGPLRLVDGLVIAYLGWAALALAINSPAQAVQNAGAGTVDFLGGYLIARASLRRARDFGIAAGWLGVLVTLSLPLAIWETQTSTAPLMALADALPGVTSDTDFTYLRLGVDRAQMGFPHPILYGLVCASALSLVVLGTTWSIPLRASIAATVCAATLTSVSSAPALALVMQAGLIGWACATPGLRNRWLGLTAVLALAYLAVMIAANRPPLRLFLSLATFTPETAFTRLSIFHWGMVNVQASPLFGLGLGDWTRPQGMSRSLDNFWLLTAMRHGLPALVCLAGAWVLLIAQTAGMRLTGDPDLARVRLAWIFSLLGVGFCLVTVHTWDAAYAYIAYLLGAGVWLLDAAPERRTESPRRHPAPVYARDFHAAGQRPYRSTL